MAKLKAKDDYYKIILDEFKPLFREAIEVEMKLGNNIAIADAKNQGHGTKDSGLTISQKDVDNFMDKFMLNVKDANRDISKRISNAIFENTAQKGSVVDLSAMIKDIFDTDSSDHFNYKNRFKTIAKTESANILNTSSNNKAIKLGATGKYLNTVMDNRRSGICDKMQTKYGTPEEAIAMNSDFKVTVNGKSVNSPMPPFHPNCRTFVLYTFE